MAQVRKGNARHGTAYFAHSQTAGKGQRGNTWTSTERENLLLSVVIEPTHLNIQHTFRLSAAVALACYDFFKKYSGHETRIKWPNDIYWRDRKAGGILIENIIQNDWWSYSIVGVGININQTSFNPGLPNPISLKQITGESYNLVSLAKELCMFLQERYERLLFAKDAIIDDYIKCLYKLNESVRLRKKNIVFDTVLTGVTASGKLLTRDSVEREFDFGEVEWIL
jgi:BirA family biotin operon repressor/biotin-[acetyl-CoA-carboxylase] ligase